MLLAPSAVGAQTRSDGDASGFALYRAPEDGGVRRWRVEPAGDLPLADAPSDAAPIVFTAAEGDVLSNFGCAEAAERVWCAVAPLRGGAKGFAPADRLSPAQGPDGMVARGVDDSKRRARAGDFDARTEIDCAQERGQALGRCAAAVARSGGGDATVAARFPNGFARQLYFADGQFISASATMSGVGRDADWRLENDVYVLRVDDQRYMLPKAFVLGR